MAIKPEHLMIPAENDKAECDRREKQIDEALRQKARMYRGGAITLNDDLFSKDGVIRDELARRYRVAGWVVKFEDDQRDGPWVSMSAAPRPKHGALDGEK